MHISSLPHYCTRGCTTISLFHEITGNSAIAILQRIDPMESGKETWAGPTNTENTTDTGTNVDGKGGNFTEEVVTVGDQSENDYDEDYISDFEA